MKFAVERPYADPGKAARRHDVREFTDRKETHWGKWKLKRDE